MVYGSSSDGYTVPVVVAFPVIGGSSLRLGLVWIDASRFAEEWFCGVARGMTVLGVTGRGVVC